MQIFKQNSDPHDGIDRLLDDDKLCPPWRNFRERFYRGAAPPPVEAPVETDQRRGETFRVFPNTSIPRTAGAHR